MARVEKDLGQRLEWAAVNHHDTDHPHAHIVVRGVDARGREVRFDREYISNGLRWRAQELATQELGPRTELEVRRARGQGGHPGALHVARPGARAPRAGERRRLRAGSRRRGVGGIDASILLARLSYLESLQPGGAQVRRPPGSSRTAGAAT